MVSIAEPFIGEIQLFPAHFVPRGWLPCEGQRLQIRDHMQLFAVIGTAFGGNGKTDFCLPNLQGRAALHSGQGPKLTPRPFAGHGGSKEVTLTPDQMPAHRHGTVANDQTSLASAVKSPAGSVWAKTSLGYRQAAPSPDLRLANDAILEAGGGAAHDNMQPYLVLQYMIAATGIFPMKD